jgi:rare lipoprotein A
MKRIIPLIITGLAVCALCAAQTQPAPAGTGVSANSGFKQEGIASWYGAEFAGRPTASGEIFSPADFTAAHPSLPFGTILRVTNKHNSKQVVVRVNDRGPFVSARIIDVSRAAAEVLDIISTGTAPVLVEWMGSAGSSVAAAPATAAASGGAAGGAAAVSAAPPRAAAPRPEQRLSALPTRPADIKPAIPQDATGKHYRLQVGSYKIPGNAVDAFDKLKNAGLSPAYEQYEDFYRVVLAGVRAGEIQSIAEKLGAAGFREALIREEL